MKNQILISLSLPDNPHSTTAAVAVEALDPNLPESHKSLAIESMIREIGHMDNPQPTEILRKTREQIDIILRASKIPVDVIDNSIAIIKQTKKQN